MEAWFRSLFRSWWQRIKQHPYTTGVVVVLVIILFTFTAYLFGWDWAGISGGESKVTTTMTIPGTPTVTPIGTPGTTVATETQPPKTLWDWLGLLAIIAVPVAVGFGVAWFTHSQQVHDQQLAEQQTKREKEAAEARAENEYYRAWEKLYEELLQKYFDDMSELLLEQDLLNSQPTGAVPTIARARTLAVLRRMSQTRRGLVLQFLQESKLIDKNKRIVDLRGADLGAANLHGADLHGADLSEVNLGLDFGDIHAELGEANLAEADLSNANLVGANLAEADLRGVNLSKANLAGANLKDAKNITTEELEKQARSLKGAIMPDGKMYRNSSGANLRGSNLSGVDLSGVDLSGADLSYSNLTDADLSGANLEDAYLKDAIGITNEELEKQAKSLQGATMPDRSIHP